MYLALLCSLLWGIGGFLMCSPASAIFSLIPLAISLPFAFIYTKNTWPFWLKNQEPDGKQWLYQCLALSFFAFGIGLWLVRLQVAHFIGSMIHSSRPVYEAVGMASLIASGPLFLFGFFNAYISWKVGALRKVRNPSAKKIEEEIAKKTTGRLADKKDFEQGGNHQNAGVFMGGFENKPVFLKDAVHIISYGGPGSGKTVGCVVPNILNWSGSLFVTDPKGELAVMTADHRRSMGNDVIFLNPWEMLGTGNTPYNPLQILLKDVANTKNPAAHASLKNREVDDARVLAQVLIPEPPLGDQNKWVREGARDILQAYMLHFAMHEQRLCSLLGLQSTISADDDTYLGFLMQMALSRDFNGTLANFGNRICSSYKNEPQQHANCRTEAAQSLRTFVTYGAMKKSVSVNARFDMEKFVKKPTTIYLTVPGEHREANEAWMKLVMTNAVEAVGRFGDNNKPCLFLLDEFANLGRLANIRKGLAEYRSFGFRAWLIVQDREQLTTVYPGSEAKALENLCDVHQILNCNFAHATELSSRIGKRGEKRMGFVDGGTFDQNYSSAQRSYQIDEKDILTTNQILQLRQRQLVFPRSSVPMLLDICPYWTIEPWKNQVRENPTEKKSNDGRTKLKIPPRNQ